MGHSFFREGSAQAKNVSTAQIGVTGLPMHLLVVVSSLSVSVRQRGALPVC